MAAYEADVSDPGRHLGWSAVVTGRARTVSDADEGDLYAYLLCPWVAGRMTGALRFRPDPVTGFRLDADPTRPLHAARG